MDSHCVMNLAEVSEFTRVSENTLRAEIRAGRLAAIPIGGGTMRKHYRITGEAVMKWLGIQNTGHGQDAGGTGAAPRPPFSPLPASPRAGRRR
jgi:excisionase family DNA binding protein